LTIATGIVDRSVLDELIRVQISPKTLTAFSLFPAVYVAWADGHVEAAEREAVLKSAENLGVSPASPAYELLQSWLHEKPSVELFRAWEGFIHAVRPTLSAKGFLELQNGVTSRARKVAAAAGGILGVHKVSTGEEAAIEALDVVFADANAKSSASTEA